MHKNLPYKQEVYRKFIHLSSSIIPISLLLFDITLIRSIIVVLAVIFPLIDLLRQKNKVIKLVYNKFFSYVTRAIESNSITGATYVFIGAAIVAILFPPKIAEISLFIMSFSDSFAAIIGIKFGNTKLLNKSLEGSTAFFITSLIILFAFGVSPLLSLITAITATYVELIASPKLNDNIFIPLTASIVLYIGGF